MRGFFLKAMQHINGMAEFDGVDRPVGVALKILDNFQYARAAKPFERFGLLVFSAFLSQVKGVTKNVLHFIGQCHQILLRRGYPEQWFAWFRHETIISKWE